MSSAEPNLWTPSANAPTLALAQEIEKLRREDRQHTAELARAMLPPGPRLEAYLRELLKP